MGNGWGGGLDNDDFDKQFDKMASHTRKFMWAMLAFLIVLAAVAFVIGYKVVMHFWW